METTKKKTGIDAVNARATKIMEFALAQMRASGIRGGKATGSPVWLASLDVHRGFSVSGIVSVDLTMTANNTLLAKVKVNFPAIARDIPNAAAFAALVQEMTAFAVSLNVEIAEFMENLAADE